MDDIFIVSKNAASGLFSGGNSLFDNDDDDNDFWNTKPVASRPPEKKPNKSDEIFGEKADQKDVGDIFANAQNEDSNIKVVPAKTFGGLFDDEQDDDDFFGTSAVLPPPKKSIFTSSGATAPLLSDEPPELDSSKPKEIIPRQQQQQEIIKKVCHVFLRSSWRSYSLFSL